MRFGTSFSSPLGSPELAVEYLKIEQIAGLWFAKWRLRAGYGDRVVYVANNSVRQAILIAKEGQHQITPIIPNRQKDISVCILPLGYALWPAYNLDRVTRTFETGDSKRVTIPWRWVPDVIGDFEEDTYTTNWALDGITRLNSNVETQNRYWTSVTYTITVSGGNATVAVLVNGVEVASGTGAVNTTITLTEQNDSGISGSVTVSAAAATSSGKVVIRWPKSMQIIRGTSSPPTAVVSTVDFNDQDTGIFTESADLNSGTLYYRIRPISETGDLGTVSDITEVLIPGPPKPPTDLAYQSGDYDAVIVQWTPSVTAGATYRIYASTDGVIDPYNPSTTAIAGATQATLPELPFPGEVFVTVRAVNGSDEEKNCDTLVIELDDVGDFVPPRPNRAGFARESLLITSSRSLSVRGVYNTENELGVATQLKLFARAPGAAYDYDTPIATTALAASRDGWKAATLQYTFPANGQQFIVIRAATAIGTLGPASEEIAIYPSDEDMPAATDFSVIVSRG